VQHVVVVDSVLPGAPRRAGREYRVGVSKRSLAVNGGQGYSVGSWISSAEVGLAPRRSVRNASRPARRFRTHDPTGEGVQFASVPEWTVEATPVDRAVAAALSIANEAGVLAEHAEIVQTRPT
jgi:hypothetical protein